MTRFITHLVLGAFLANTGLCPCASAVADAEPAQVANMPALDMHHAAGHDGHAAGAGEPTAKHAHDACHTETPIDQCSMSAGLDLDLRSPESDRSDLMATIAGVQPLFLAKPVARAGPPAPSEARAWPADDPITRHDRLLI